MKHMRNILHGMTSVLGSLSSRRAYVTPLDGFAQDTQALAKDAHSVAADFKKQGDLVYGTFTTRTSKNR